MWFKTGMFLSTDNTIVTIDTTSYSKFLVQTLHFIKQR